MKQRVVKNYIYLMLMALLVIMVSACFSDEEETGGNDALVRAGDKVPGFSIVGTDGRMITAESLVGQTFILNFFDTGCPDCRREFEVLQRIYDKYQTAVPMLNVPRSQTQEEVEKYWQETGLTIPYYMASDKKLYYKFANRGIPRTYIVDGSGKICADFCDSPTADYETLDSILQQLVGEETVKHNARQLPQLKH